MRKTRRSIDASPGQEELAAYMVEIARYKLLTKSEELALARRIREGDREAREILIQSNLRLVIYIAKKYRANRTSFGDLVASGNLGLIHATELFNPDLNIRFATYASYWIAQSIKRAILNTDKTIKIPVYIQELATRWLKTKADLSTDTYVPTDQDLRKIVKLYDEEISDANMDALQSAIKLMHVYRICEVSKDKEFASKLNKAIVSEEVASMLSYLDKLPLREREVIKFRFGIDCEARSLQSIGDEIHLTRERVRQIEAEALQRLRKCMMS